MPETDNNVDETFRFSQLSLLPSDRNCLGRSEEPRMLNVGTRMSSSTRKRLVGRYLEGVFYFAIGNAKLSRTH